MDHHPRITAEADIGERDESVVLDNFRLEANNVFPGSIKGTKMIHKRLVLTMTRPATLPGEKNRERCHAQIRDIFRRMGLDDVMIEETAGESSPHASPNVVLAIPTPSDELTTHTTA